MSQSLISDDILFDRLMLIGVMIGASLMLLAFNIPDTIVTILLMMTYQHV